jgi:hypothetical protein
MGFLAINELNEALKERDPREIWAEVSTPPIYMTTIELSVQQPWRGGPQRLMRSTNVEIKAN